MIKTDNPAGRLHFYLDAARNFELHNVRTESVWMKVFETAHADRREMARRLLQLHDLYDEVVRRIEAEPSINTELFLNELPSLRKAFDFVNLPNKFSDVVPLITDVAMTSLAFCSNTLSERYGEREIPEGDLEELLSEINELEESIRESDIDEVLESTLLTYLSAMRTAIGDYGMQGAAAIALVTEQSLGSMILKRDDFEPIAKRQEFVSFWEIMARANALTSLAQKAADHTPKLVEAVKFLIEK